MNIPFHSENTEQSGLDLNEFLIKRKSSTFIVKVSGDSMIDANIQEGDLLIIDRSKDPVNGSLIVAVVNSEFTVKEYCKKAGRVFLLPRNKKYKPYEVFPEADFLVWGVVTFIIHHAEKI
jgi:DNA polymerase V